MSDLSSRLLVTQLDFPLWLRASHFLTIVFIALLMRSGLEILSAGPRLYLNDDCRPGGELVTLGRRRLPTEGLWTSTARGSRRLPDVACRSTSGLAGRGTTIGSPSERPERGAARGGSGSPVSETAAPTSPAMIPTAAIRITIVSTKTQTVGTMASRATALTTMSRHHKVTISSAG